MRTTILMIACTFLFTINSCRQPLERESAINYEYFDLAGSDTIDSPALYAVTDEEYLQYGARVAYLNNSGDTIIPIGKYRYYGTDTLLYYANVIESPGDSTFGRQIGITPEEKVLFDLVMFDNGPEPFIEGLTRVLRNGRMGYSNKFGHVVIPCIYDYATQFDGGIAEVTFDATEYLDGEEHTTVESDEWFTIDKHGKKVNVKNTP
jgi:hypothetical protein